MKHKPAPPFNGLAQFQIEHGSLGVLGTQRRKRRTLSAIDDTFMLATRSVTAEISMFPDIIHCMRSLDLSLASASSTNPFLAKITKLPRELENFATSRGLKNLNEHGVIMPKQTQLAIDEQQSSATAVSAFYATLAAVGTLGVAVLIISANVAYAVGH